MQPGIFREYDIRGVVDKEISDADVSLLGRVIGTYMENHGVKEITLGQDCRLSSPHYHDLLLEGLLASGRKVIDIGVCPTPLLYFSVWHYKTQGGVMITASHNPKEYNGFKVMLGKTTIFGEEIQKLYQMSQHSSFAKGRGSVSQSPIVEPYIDYVSRDIKLAAPLHLAVDAANGTAGPVATKLMEKLGIKVEPLYCEMDGNFPNHEADPTVEANLRDLQEVVRAKKLRAGIAYDGDSDRVGIIDENGTPIWGDMLLCILARSILSDNPGATFIGEVKCSKNLYDDIKKRGGNGIMWKAGHSLIKQKMAETGALLAGEMSGHIFFKHRWFGFDDGIYASMRFAELLAQNSAPLSTWLADLPQTYSTPEIRATCPDELKFKVVERVSQAMKSKYQVIDIDGVRVTFADGWGLVRASNTGPNLVMRFEAERPERLAEIQGLVQGAVEEAIKQG